MEPILPTWTTDDELLISKAVSDALYVSSTADFQEGQKVPRVGKVTWIGCEGPPCRCDMDAALAAGRCLQGG